MNLQTALRLMVAATCAACASTSTPTPSEMESGLRVTATAVEVQPELDASTTSDASQDPAEARAALARASGRQILVSATIEGRESVQLPKVLMLADQQATMFVGSVDADGVEDGVHIDVTVAGDRATLEARELAQGEVIGQTTLIVPVQLPGADEE